MILAGGLQAPRPAARAAAGYQDWCANPTVLAESGSRFASQGQAKLLEGKLQAHVDWA